MTFTHAYGEQWSQGALWPRYTRYIYDTSNKLISGWSLDTFERTIGPYYPTCSQMGIPPELGRLCFTLSGAGKRRIFAIGNYINKRLLKPVHDWLMEVLRILPTDGTFDQHKPLKRLKGRMSVFSYDLTAATEPLLLLFEVMQMFFDRSFASSVVNSALATNCFSVPFVKRAGSVVSFVKGQPLGYYASWALFSLTHHMMVWLAAEKVYPGKRFLDYAVLGDDVIIANDRVAPIYSSLIDKLGVKISLQKSLISNSGAAEFAKRFLVNGMGTDLSPVSVKSLTNYFHPLGAYAIAQKYSIKRFSSFCRINGVGYRGLSSLSSEMKMSKRE